MHLIVDRSLCARRALQHQKAEDPSELGPPGWDAAAAEPLRSLPRRLPV